jgi:hypothetical protein
MYDQIQSSIRSVIYVSSIILYSVFYILVRLTNEKQKNASPNINWQLSQ